jgi:hypothetical protein
LTDSSQERNYHSQTIKSRFFSDGNDDYVFTLPKYYADTCIDYGYYKNKRRWFDKIKTIIYGNPIIDEIETTDIENMNGIFVNELRDWLEKLSVIPRRNQDLKTLLNYTNSIGISWICYLKVAHLQ